MLVAGSAVPLVTALMAIVGAGESATGSVNGAVIVNLLPVFAELSGEYVRAAVGAAVSTRTTLVSGGVKSRLALLPNASLIVPPLELIAGATAMPSASLSPLTMV